jgi:signal transduction histidine kinase
MQKIEDGGLQLQFEAFDLLAMVRVTLGTFKDLLAAKQLTLVTHMQPLEQQSWAQMHLKDHPGKLLVHGDKYRLRQVLSNFLSNAIAYSPPFGTITVRVSDSDFRPSKPPLAHGDRAGGSNLLRADTSGSSLHSQIHLVGRHARSPASSADNLRPPVVESAIEASRSSAEASSSSDLTADRSQHASHTESSFSSKHPTHTHSHSSSLHRNIGRVTFRVSVADSGPGIPQEFRSLIFSAYKQVQSARIQQGRGTGSVCAEWNASVAACAYASVSVPCPTDLDLPSRRR